MSENEKKKLLEIKDLKIYYPIKGKRDAEGKPAYVKAYLGHLVEEGDTDEVFDRPQHPYTRTLMSAVPSIDPRDNRQRILLEGDLPSPIDPPSGCVFHTRCPWATEACKTASCELREVRKGHYAACSRGEQE